MKRPQWPPWRRDVGSDEATGPMEPSGPEPGEVSQWPALVSRSLGIGTDLEKLEVYTEQTRDKLKQMTRELRAAARSYNDLYISYTGLLTQIGDQAIKLRLIPEGEGLPAATARSLEDILIDRGAALFQPELGTMPGQGTCKVIGQKQVDLPPGAVAEVVAPGLVLGQSRVVLRRAEIREALPPKGEEPREPIQDRGTAEASGGEQLGTAPEVERKTPGKDRGGDAPGEQLARAGAPDGAAEGGVG